jgi:hypothetical protein
MYFVSEKRNFFIYIFTNINISTLKAYICYMYYIIVIIIVINIIIIIIIIIILRACCDTSKTK